MSKTRNIIIFIVIGAVFVLIYIFFIKPSAPVPTLVSSSPSGVAPVAGALATENNPSITKDFLNLLLNVTKIKLNETIFSDPAFISLHDSSIVLIPDGNEGRINPFAPLGNDATTKLPPTCTLLQFLNTTTNTCVVRATCTLPKTLNSLTNTCVSPSQN